MTNRIQSHPPLPPSPIRRRAPFLGRLATIAMATAPLAALGSLAGCSVTDARPTPRTAAVMPGLGPEACPVERFSTGSAEGTSTWSTPASASVPARPAGTEPAFLPRSARVDRAADGPADERGSL